MAKSGKQLNVYIRREDEDLLERFEDVVSRARSDKTKTIKFLMEQYVQIMEKNFENLDAELRERITDNYFHGAVTKKKQNKKKAKK